MNLSLAGSSFSHVGGITPRTGESGEISAEFPQSRYSNRKNLPLHSYGEGPFCEFEIAKNWASSGVYILTKENKALYVGEYLNLQERWGPRGYARIHPRNCFKGGQQTNCRINHLIYRELVSGVQLDLWFMQVDGDKHTLRELESKVISAATPPWNR